MKGPFGLKIMLSFYHLSISQITIHNMYKKEITPKATNEMVNLFKTTYHYYRNWVKHILQGNVIGFKFIKDKIGWEGFISVPKSEIQKTKSVLQEYKSKNPEAKEMWW